MNNLSLTVYLTVIDNHIVTPILQQYIYIAISGVEITMKLLEWVAIYSFCASYILAQTINFTICLSSVNEG